VSLTRIIVLANSWKHKDWCLAGIDINAGCWVRPVTSDTEDGRVRRRDMRLPWHFPELLDILGIPLDATGPDFGFETENRTILQGRWKLEGRVSPNDVFQYVERASPILHNSRKYVTLPELQQIPVQQRRTLQLIRVMDFSVTCETAPTRRKKWRGNTWTGTGILDLPITDPVFIRKLDTGHTPSPQCLLTISLAMPWKSSDSPPGEPQVCWKLIAGVIEL